MATGINIKVLPQATTVQGSDRIIIDRNITGTLVIPFSSISVDENQVTFYSDFLNLSAYTYALSSSTNSVFARLGTDINQLSSETKSTISFLRTDLNTVSTNANTTQTNTIQISTNVTLLSSGLISLSSNTTTFISGGISPSGLIVPAKVGIIYFAANTKDYFVSINNLNDQNWRRILTVDY